jgi:hypothetical protein
VAKKLELIAPLRIPVYFNHKVVKLAKWLFLRLSVARLSFLVQKAQHEKQLQCYYN